MIFLYVKKSKLTKGFTSLTLLLIAALLIAVVNLQNTGVFLNTNRKLPIYCVDTKEKKVALTFDASWGEDNTEEILKVLNKYDVKATFFLVGAWIDQHPEKLKAIHTSGHEIGNHTDRHPEMSTITRERLIREIEIADSKIRKITGSGTKLFRAPSGSYNNLVVETVESMNRYCIQWNVDSIDWREEGADIEYNRVIKKARPGSIILFHNEAKHTPGNLPRIIEYLKKQGYSFVTVSELIYKDNYRLDSTGKQIYKKNN
jgi:peptidoglycan-N-acetylglucosamine deacetylase